MVRLVGWSIKISIVLGYGNGVVYQQALYENDCLQLEQKTLEIQTGLKTRQMNKFH